MAESTRTLGLIERNSLCCACNKQANTTMPCLLFFSFFAFPTKFKINSNAQLTDEEIQIVADKGCHVVHCPSSNMKLASGFCPVAKLLNAGVNVAIGTDGAACNNTLDMFSEMHITALIAKGYSGDATAVDADTALRMATINGAKALRLDDRIGSVEVGKAADVIAVDLSALETQPIYSVISHLVYCCNRSHVTNVWVDGRRVLKDRQLTTIDETRVRDQVAIWRDRVLASVEA
jgi:5-methylthioadenosine/S-adenosylhomocysteine deaminase